MKISVSTQTWYKESLTIRYLEELGFEYLDFTKMEGLIFKKTKTSDFIQLYIVSWKTSLGYESQDRQELLDKLKKFEIENQEKFKEFFEEHRGKLIMSNLNLL